MSETRFGVALPELGRMKAVPKHPESLNLSPATSWVIPSKGNAPNTAIKKIDLEMLEADMHKDR